MNRWKPVRNAFEGRLCPPKASGVNASPAPPVPGQPPADNPLTTGMGPWPLTRASGDVPVASTCRSAAPEWRAAISRRRLPVAPEDLAGTIVLAVQGL